MLQVDIINKNINNISLVRYLELNALRSRLYFTSQDVAAVLGIKPPSALVFCTRYVKKGLFIRLKKDIYTMKERWQEHSTKDFYRISNFLQVPSYISLMTALSFYEVTTQVQRGFFESVCIKRTGRFEIEGIIFNFYKFKKDLYFDFTRQEDFFIATKEKAFLDAVYLYSFGKYAFDKASIDVSKLDFQRIEKLLKVYPERTQITMKSICKI